MAKHYFIKKDPKAAPEQVQWVTLTGKEFYAFITSREGDDRFFIDMGDFMIEADKSEYTAWRKEADHESYLRKLEEGRSVLSLYSGVWLEGRARAESIVDTSVDVEGTALLSLEKEALRLAISKLDARSYHLIYVLYLAKNRKTERDLAAEYGVSQNAIHKQKKEILKNLKFLVVKGKKISQ